MTLTRAQLPPDPTLARWELARIGAADGSIAARHPGGRSVARVPPRWPHRGQHRLRLVPGLLHHQRQHDAHQRRRFAAHRLHRGTAAAGRRDHRHPGRDHGLRGAARRPRARGRRRHHAPGPRPGHRPGTSHLDTDRGPRRPGHHRRRAEPPEHVGRPVRRHRRRWPRHLPRLQGRQPAVRPGHQCLRPGTCRRALQQGQQGRSRLQPGGRGRLPGRPGARLVACPARRRSWSSWTSTDGPCSGWSRSPSW